MLRSIFFFSISLFLLFVLAEPFDLRDVYTSSPEDKLDFSGFTLHFSKANLYDHIGEAFPASELTRITRDIHNNAGHLPPILVSRSLVQTSARQREEALKKVMETELRKYRESKRKAQDSFLKACNSQDLAASALRIASVVPPGPRKKLETLKCKAALDRRASHQARVEHVMDIARDKARNIVKLGTINKSLREHMHGLENRNSKTVRRSEDSSNPSHTNSFKLGMANKDDEQLHRIYARSPVVKTTRTQREEALMKVMQNEWQKIKDSTKAHNVAYHRALRSRKLASMAHSKQEELDWPYGRHKLEQLKEKGASLNAKREIARAERALMAQMGRDKNLFRIGLINKTLSKHMIKLLRDPATSRLRG